MRAHTIGGNVHSIEYIHINFVTYTQFQFHVNKWISSKCTRVSTWLCVGISLRLCYNKNHSRTRGQREKERQSPPTPQSPLFACAAPQQKYFIKFIENFKSIDCLSHTAPNLSFWKILPTQKSFRYVVCFVLFMSTDLCLCLHVWVFLAKFLPNPKWVCSFFVAALVKLSKWVWMRRRYDKLMLIWDTDDDMRCGIVYCGVCDAVRPTTRSENSEFDFSLRYPILVRLYL